MHESIVKVPSSRPQIGSVTTPTPERSFNESIKLVLTPSDNLLAKCMELIRTIETFSPAVSESLGVALASHEKEQTLAFSAAMAVTELGTNAVLYGLLGMEGELRVKYNTVTRLLRLPDEPSAEALTDANRIANDFITALQGSTLEERNFATVSEAVVAVNEALANYFESKRRFNQHVIISVRISNEPAGSNSMEEDIPVITIDRSRSQRSLVISFSEPSNYALLNKWMSSGEFGDEGIEDITGRGIGIVKLLFPVTDGCYVNDFGQAGFFQIVVPLEILTAGRN